MKNILLIVFIILSATHLFGKVNYHFQYYTIEDGLPQNTVNDIIKDSDNWMWFATGNGLARFDGYSFDVYHKPHLPSNLVNSIAESNDRIWIGTSQGLAFFNKELESINIFKLESANNDFVQITSLFVDKNGNVWVATFGDGVYLLQKDGHNYNTINFNISNSSLSGNNVYSFSQLSDGRVLIGTNHGISTYDSQNNSLYTFSFGNLDEATVFSIYETLEGDLWVGTYNGLWVFNSATGKDEWYFHNPQDPNSLSHNRTNKITQDFRGTIYIGTLGGVNIYQPKTNSFASIAVNDNTDFSLNNMFISVIYPDNSGNIWIGTEKGGVNKFNLYQKPFNHIVREKRRDEIHTNNTINSILVDGDFLWLGTAGEGLNKFNRKTGASLFYESNPLDNSSISGNYVTSLIKDNNNILWAGTWGGGISKMLPNGKFKRFYPSVPNEESGFFNSFVSTLLLDEKYLFVGTEGGLAIMDLKTEEFLDINIHSPLAKLKEIGWIIKDNDNFIWVASRYGLYYFHKDKLSSPYDVMNPEGFVAKIREEKQNSAGLLGNYVTFVFEDSKHNLWAGTYGDGISKITKKEDGQFDFQNFTVNDGLCNNVIYSIQEDNSGR